MLFGIASILAASPASTRDYPFGIKGCDFSSGGGDCRFSNLQQCQGTASGLAAICVENPYANAEWYHSRNRQFTREILMRSLVLASLTVLTAAITGPAAAQTYGSGYPVCLHVYGPGNYYECRYISLAQCNASASGRAAQCELNPYVANADNEPMLRPYRQRRVY